jgi:Family of unknown function (DUF5681)
MAEIDEDKPVENYSVGYGRPPVDSRFKKGQSGNPTGRPKGTPNLSTVLQKTLSERVVVNENGKRKTISKMQAFVKQLVNKAASGDLRAAAQVTEILKSIEQNADQDPQEKGPNELDRKTILNLLKRCEKSTKGADRDE